MNEMKIFRSNIDSKNISAARREASTGPFIGPFGPWRTVEDKVTAAPVGPWRSQQQEVEEEEELRSKNITEDHGRGLELPPQPPRQHRD